MYEFDSVTLRNGQCKCKAAARIATLRPLFPFDIGISVDLLSDRGKKVNCDCVGCLEKILALYDLKHASCVSIYVVLAGSCW